MVLGLTRAEAFEKTAFSGVETLVVEVHQARILDDIVPEDSLRTKAELTLRRSAVPVSDKAIGGPWLEIYIMAIEVKYEDGKGTGGIACAAQAQLKDGVIVWRNGKSRYMTAIIWSDGLWVAAGPRNKMRDLLLRHITEVAEEVSDLYLATH